MMKYLNRIRKQFDNLSLRSKLCSIVLIIGALIFLIFLAGLRLSGNAYNRQLYKAVSGNLSFSSQTIAGNLKNVETLSSLAIASPDIQNSLAAIDSTDDTIVWSNAKQTISTAISNYQQAYKREHVVGIALYNNHFPNWTNVMLSQKVSTRVIRQALEEARAQEGAIVWSIDYDSRTAILSRSIRKISNLDLNHLGDLLIFVDLDAVVQNANQAVTTYDDTRYILYRDDQLIYTPQDMTEDTAAYFNRRTSRPYSIIPRNGHSYFSVKNQIPYYGWTYINLVPYDQISRAARTTFQLILIILFSSLLVSVLVFRRMTHYILKDFDLLIRKMEHFSSTELELPQLDVDYSTRTDEISRLHQHFDTMADRIKNLVQTNYLTELSNREARLKALEAQINPHFLYNTLETINWRAKALRDEPISSMVESLGSLLRATLSNKKSLVTLDYEFGLANSYMTIQKIRFEERLIFSMECEEGLKDALILPLAIQPLLENAIRYGMEEMTEPCTIGIRARRDGANLVVSVFNDGSCFEEHLLEKLLSGERNPHGFGIGLVNIHQRIQMLFGDGYGLSFQNQDETAIAIITIPYTI